jgi:hypothetical protein
MNINNLGINLYVVLISLLIYIYRTYIPFIYTNLTLYYTPLDLTVGAAYCDSTGDTKLEEWDW